MKCLPEARKTEMMNEPVNFSFSPQIEARLLEESIAGQ
jgi:hypothetical protein